MLIFGGISESRTARADGEVWNLETGTMTRVAASQRRSSHMATLLADGRVLLTGGTSSDSPVESDAEVFDPRTNLVTPLTIPLADDGGIPVVTEVRPANGATEVPVEAIVTLRLSHAVRIDSITEQHVLLSGPQGPGL